MDLKTPSGYAVSLKQELTYGEFIEIQNILTSSMELDIKSGEVKKIDASVISRSNSKAIEFVVQSVTMPDGKKATNIVGAIMGMPMRDGQLVAAEVNKIANVAQVDQKKGA